MCLLTSGIIEHPKCPAETSTINIRTIINQDIISSTSTPTFLPKSTTHTHSYTHNRSTKLKIHNFNHQYITRPPLSTNRVRQNRSPQNIPTFKQPQNQTITPPPTTDTLTSREEVHTSGRIPKKFKTSQSTHISNTTSTTHQKRAIIKSAYANKLNTTTTEVFSTHNNTIPKQSNKQQVQRIGLSSSTETSLQVKNDNHHYKLPETVYSNGLVLVNNKLNNDQNRSRINISQVNNRCTYASCLKASIDPIQQLLALQLQTKINNTTFQSITRYNNKWKNQKHRKQSYQHNRHNKQTKRYYHKEYQTKKLLNLYCESNNKSGKSLKPYDTQPKVSNNIIITNNNNNYYSILSDPEGEDNIDFNTTEQWDEEKYTNHLYSGTQELSKQFKIDVIDSITKPSIITSQDYPISFTTKKKRYNPKIQDLLETIMPRTLKKPSTILQSLKRNQDNHRESTKDTSSIRSNRSEKTTRSYESNKKQTLARDDTTAESEDDKSNDSTVQVANKSKDTDTKEKWKEIKKQVNDIHNNPLCPNIPDAVPETIMEKPPKPPNPNIQPTCTISLMVYIKGPSHWEQMKGKKRRPIFKIRKILLGFLYAAQRVCSEARLCNVYKDASISDILQIDDIPKTEIDEKSFVFDAQLYRGTFQGQILLKSNKEFNDFIRNADFQNWLQMENIQIKLQPHTGVKFVKIGFFTEVINNLAMDSFHVKTLNQWLPTKLPPFELFSETIYTTHNKKKFSCRVLYVLCTHTDRNEINSQIEAISNAIPWQYYESKYFHAFDSELKSDKIKLQRDLHKTTTSYLIPGFLDNDTILMDYTKHTIPSPTDETLSNTETTANNNNSDADPEKSETDSNDDEMESDSNENDEEITDADTEITEPKTNNNDESHDPTNINEQNATDNTNDEIIIPNDYVGSFMEIYYKNEHEQPIYFQVGPVIENKREVLVLKKNRLYAEQMNQIIIADLSLHMTPEACTICLERDTIQQQIQTYRTWTPCHIQKYMAFKNIYKLTESTDTHNSFENPTKRQRNEPPAVITTNKSIMQSSEIQTQIKAAAAEVFADDIIDIVKKTTDKHLLDIQQTHNDDKIDKVEFDTAITIWKAKYTYLEETLKTNTTTMETLINTLNLNELKTKSRFDTVYDTIDTKCTEFEGTVLKVKEETQEMYAKAQDIYDNKHDELRQDNRALDEKMDKLLGHFNKKSEKKLKSKQAIASFKEQLTHHTSESMTISKHE